ncbi:MAG TPA: DUF1674 domain-containing protein [Steroidobacteraceae bacterium]|nr:DUF1674 domain-containing protein [Steroidobacteraceae bacterium]
MSDRKTPSSDADAPSPPPPQATAGAPQAAREREVGGRGGPEPTRFGDWEKDGRCIDF